MVVYKMVSNAVEIAATPERVRAVFLDFARLPEWHSQHFKSIELPANKQGSDLLKGDTLKVTMSGMTFRPTVLENSANKFEWRGSLPLLLNGDHAFEFTPSKTTPGHTTFVQYENFSGLLTWLNFTSEPKQTAGFDALNVDLKKRVESLSDGTS